MIQKTASKKWVDYSDEDSSDQEHHHHHTNDAKTKDNSKQENKKEPPKYQYIPTREQIDSELDRLDELDHNKIDEVWLLMTSQDQDYLKKEIDYLKGKAKKNGNIVSVYPSRLDKDCYDVLVFIKIAYDYIQLGYDNSNRMKVNVAQRNFQKKSNERVGKRKQNDYKQKSSFDKEGEKKKYVDKQTGKQPETKKQFEEKVVENSQRMYSKQEAEKKGEILGGFRNKPAKKQEEIQQIVIPIDDLKVSKKTSTETEPKDVEKIVEQVKQQKPKQVKKDKNESKKVKADEKKIKKSKVSKVKSLNPFEGIESLD